MVRDGSLPTVSRLTIRSQLTITFFAAFAPHLQSPPMPHICALPSSSACWTWMMATSGLERGHEHDGAPVEGRIDHLVLVLAHERFDVHEVGPHHVLDRHEGHAHGARHEHQGKREVGVLLQLDLMRDAFFDRAPVAARQPVQAQRNEGRDEALHAPRADEHVEIVRRVAARDGEVALFLPDDFVDGRERRPADISADEEKVAVADELPHGFCGGHHLAHNPPPSCSC